MLTHVYFSDIISNCEQELFAKADNLFSDDGILSHLETDQLMEDDVSYDFLNLPNNLVDLKQESKLSLNLPNNLVLFNHESKPSSNLSNNLVDLKQEPQSSLNHSNGMLDFKPETKLSLNLPNNSAHFNHESKLSSNASNNLVDLKQESHSSLNHSNAIVEIKSESNLPTHFTAKPTGSLEDPRTISLPQVPFDSGEKYKNKSFGFVSQGSLTSPPQVVPKHLKTHENPCKVVPQAQSYILQQPQQYRNIQPNPTTIKAASIHTVKPHSHRKSKPGTNVVTVQSMGQIHVPADQMKQVGLATILSFKYLLLCHKFNSSVYV